MKTIGAREEQPTVLLLGGTGRTGRLVLSQLLERGVIVRAIVRSADGCPKESPRRPGSRWSRPICCRSRTTTCGAWCRGATRSSRASATTPRSRACSGHRATWSRRPRRRICRAIEALQPAEPVKFILMSSVSVNQPAGRDARRGRFEKAVVALMRGVVPPAKDNQSAADFLCDGVGTADPFVEWVAVRPDSLLEGEVTEYSLHDSLVSSLFRPDSTNRANVAHFMCELVQDPRLWDEWRSVSRSSSTRPRKVKGDWPQMTTASSSGRSSSSFGPFPPPASLSRCTRSQGSTACAAQLAAASQMRDDLRDLNDQSPTGPGEVSLHPIHIIPRSNDLASSLQGEALSGSKLPLNPARCYQKLDLGITLQIRLHLVIVARRDNQAIAFEPQLADVVAPRRRDVRPLRAGGDHRYKLGRFEDFAAGTIEQRHVFLQSGMRSAACVAYFSPRST